jgi:hypothetical protein
MLTAPELVQAQERMLHVRDTMPGPRGSSHTLDHGSLAPDRGPRTSGTPTVCGIYRLVKGPMVRPDIGNGTSRGPASCGPGRLAP